MATLGTVFQHRKVVRKGKALSFNIFEVFISDITTINETFSISICHLCSIKEIKTILNVIFGSFFVKKLIQLSRRYIFWKM